MPLNLASLLLLIALVAAIVPPGYSAYVGAYTAMAVALVAFAIFGWKERSVFRHPTSLAIFGAIVLVTATVPFVYRGPQDLLAPVFILPMLTTVALGTLARPASWIPAPTIFAMICLLACALALAGGAYEHLVLGIYRPGLGNNPIHYSTLAAMAGGLSLVGVISTRARWRYLFLLAPVLGLGTTIVADSRGPMIGAISMTGVGLAVLTIWLWRENIFRWSLLGTALLGIVALGVLAGSGNNRVLSIAETALNVFRFTGGGDDTRAALYISSFHALVQSPFYGHGLGQLMLTAQAMFPAQREVFVLENLHADWANFSVMAGLPGLTAYILLLASPLLLLMKAEARQDRPIVLGAILLVVGQLSLGVSNAMFGVLPQTIIYAVGLGYFFVRALKLGGTRESASE